MLDVWVLKQRERVFMEQSLDPISIHECEKENVLSTIYKEIEQEAAGLRDNGTYDYRLLLRYRLKEVCSVSKISETVFKNILWTQNCRAEHKCADADDAPQGNICQAAVS